LFKNGSITFVYSSNIFMQFFHYWWRLESKRWMFIWIFEWRLFL